MMFGNPETTTGGRALKFYASIRVDIRRIQSIKEGDRVIGARTRAKIVKNKGAAPCREAEFDIIYGEGVSREGDLIDLGVTNGLLEKSGTWISYKNERLGQGRENARVFLKGTTNFAPNPSVPADGDGKPSAEAQKLAADAAAKQPPKAAAATASSQSSRSGR